MQRAIKRPFRGHAAYPFRLTIGQRLRELREGCGFTQVELGEMVGLSPSHISGIEHGKTGVPAARYELFASALGTDRRAFGLFLLRHNDPWLWRMIHGE